MNIFMLHRIISDIATGRLASNDTKSATITFDTGVAQGSIYVPATVQHLHQRSVANAHGGWAESRVSVMVCRLARTRKTAVTTPTTAISLIT